MGIGVLTPVFASEYPQRPVRIIVPVTAGGGVDTTARIVAEHLGSTLRQRFIVDNRPGGGGSIGVEIAANAATRCRIFQRYFLSFARHTGILDHPRPSGDFSLNV